jgi:hypothetical protein
LPIYDNGIIVVVGYHFTFTFATVMIGVLGQTQTCFWRTSMVAPTVKDQPLEGMAAAIKEQVEKMRSERTDAIARIERIEEIRRTRANQLTNGGISQVATKAVAINKDLKIIAAEVIRNAYPSVLVKGSIAKGVLENGFKKGSGSDFMADVTNGINTLMQEGKVEAIGKPPNTTYKWKP